MHLESSDARMFVAGHRGLVGSALVAHLRAEGYRNVLLRSRDELDLRVQADVDAFFEAERPAFVILAAARVGGIGANQRYPAEFITDNLLIQTNVLRAARAVGVRRLLFLSSACIYPPQAPQPFTEASLLSGPPEPTNRGYAVAKIAGVEMVRAFHEQYGADFWSLAPANLYGPSDRFDLQTGHVLPTLLMKFHEARQEAGEDQPVTLWGTGTPRREFMYSEDLAQACLYVLKQPEEALDAVAPDRLLNVGSGTDVTIQELAETIRTVVGSRSEIRFDATRPDGAPRKLLDSSRLRSLGWQPRTSLEDGIRTTYAWFRSQYVGA